jgi:hypothetical protein
MCDAIVVLDSGTTRHPEAPEMLRVPLGAWIGFVAGDLHPEMIVVCSAACLSALLRE